MKPPGGPSLGIRDDEDGVVRVGEDWGRNGGGGGSS